MKVFYAYLNTPSLEKIHPLLLPPNVPHQGHTTGTLSVKDTRGRRHTILPPTLHYGWILNDELIWSYAVKHGLDRHFIRLNDDDTKTTRRERMGTPRRVLERLTKELGLPHGQLRLQLIFNDCEEGRFISFCSNYRMHRFPSEEHVQLVQEFLGEKESPKWHLDLQKVEWHLESMARVRIAQVPSCHSRLWITFGIALPVNRLSFSAIVSTYCGQFSSRSLLLHTCFDMIPNVTAIQCLLCIWVLQTRN